MYAYLNGILAEKTPEMVVIDCGGIGFELRIPLSTFEQLPSAQEIVKLYVFSVTNDEGTRLFGFFTKSEKELFRLLININKIGPKTALSLMSAISIRELITAIISNNANIIARTPGFGKKTAERLIVELKDKINDIAELEAMYNASDSGSAVINDNCGGYVNDKWFEVEQALGALGYKPSEIRKALQNVKLTEQMTTQEILKTCIQFIYLKRNEI